MHRRKKEREKGGKEEEIKRERFAIVQMDRRENER